MYTIKLVNHFNSENTSNPARSNELVISCDQYEVYRHEYHALITVNGVEHRVRGHSNTGSSDDLPLPRYFEVAYVENANGKTIERIGPFDAYDWQAELRNNAEVRAAA